MARVEIAACGNGKLETPYGYPLPSVAVTVSQDQAGTIPATVYADATSATTLGTVTTDGYGIVPGWVEAGIYWMTARSVTHQLNASGPISRSTANQPGTTFSATTSSSQLLASNPQRVEWIVSLPSSFTGDVWLRYGTGSAAVGSGVLLRANGPAHRNTTWTGPVQIIATAAVTVGILEI